MLAAIALAAALSAVTSVPNSRECFISVTPGNYSTSWEEFAGEAANCNRSKKIIAYPAGATVPDKYVQNRPRHDHPELYRHGRIFFARDVATWWNYDQLVIKELTCAKSPPTIEIKDAWYGDIRFRYMALLDCHGRLLSIMEPVKVSIYETHQKDK